MKKLLVLSLWIICACGKQDEATHMPDYLAPLVEEWKIAGAQLSETDFKTKVKYSMNEGSLQNFLDTEAKKKGTVLVLIPAGEYPIDQRLIIPEGVFVKGSGDQETKIISTYKYGFEPSPFDTPCTVEFNNIKNSGISNITLVYRAVNFKPHHPQNFYDLWDNKVFKNDPNGDTLLYVGHIGIKNSSNILIDNCNVLDAGTDPIIITGSNHVSITNSLVSGSYNKGGKGNGYFNIDKGSHHILIKNNHVEKIRHLAIQKDTHHNVIIDNYLEVDVNFHNGDKGYNLITGNTIRIPEWHGWHTISAGAKSLHLPPGPNNFIFNNLSQYKHYIPTLRENITEYGDSIIYKSTSIVDTVWIKDQPMIRYEYGAIDTVEPSNILYTMNDKWNDQPSVLVKDTLDVSNIIN